MGHNGRFAAKLFASLLFAGSVSLFAGTVTLTSCGTDTLSNYITKTAFPPVTGGCAIGILDYYNFSYHPISNAPLASDIKVAVSSSAGTGFAFSRVDGNPFTAALGTKVQFEIDYSIVIDPAPIITSGDMGLDPPSGFVTVTAFFCNDVSYVFSGVCLGGGSPETLSVGTAGTGLPLSATISFVKPATTSQGVGILFTLDGTKGASSFDSLDATSTVVTLAPEPGSLAGLLLGVFALGGYKLRKRSR